MNTPPTTTCSRWKRCLPMLAVLLLGIAIGAVGTLGLVRHKFHRVAQGGPEAARQLMEKRLARRLKLRPEQKPAVAKVLRKTHHQLQPLRLQNQPAATQILDQAVAELLPLLDAEQQQTLQELVTAFRANWTERALGGQPRKNSQPPPQ